MTFFDTGGGGGLMSAAAVMCAPGDIERFDIGARVEAADGHAGRLGRVVIDPVGQALTHLVVETGHRGRLGKLVPVKLVQSVEGDRVRLSCTREKFEQLDDADDVQFLPADVNAYGYGADSLIWPNYSLAMPLHHPAERGHRPIVGDRVPAGEVEIRRGEHVHASDGWIGKVEGLVIEPASRHVTHVLLQEGHLWDRKQVAIPIGATSRVDNEIRVNLTKQQVAQLPPVELGSPS